NQTTGQYSFAAGQQAHANHKGTFVWADAQGGVLSSTSSNQFLIRASGGVGIGTTSPSKALTVQAAIGNHAIQLQNDSYPLGLLGIYGDNNSALLALASSGVNNVTLRANGSSSFTGGNVGIGTTSPQAPLHVTGPYDSQLILQDNVIGHSWSINNDHNDNLV